MARRSISIHPLHKCTPLWLVTFVDVATLMLCFLVLLTGYSTINKKNEQKVLFSVNKAFGAFTATSINSQTGSEIPAFHQNLPQVLQKALHNENMVWREDAGKAVITITTDVLFTPGSSALTPRGIKFLDTIMPYLINLHHPLLVAGHTSARQDEEGGIASFHQPNKLSSSWLLSYKRAEAVLLHLQKNEFPPHLLAMEAYGEFKPLFDNYSPSNRAKNRRVELHLDARDIRWSEKIHKNVPKEKQPETLYYRGFKFTTELPELSDKKEDLWQE